MIGTTRQRVNVLLKRFTDPRNCSLGTNKTLL